MSGTSENAGRGHSARENYHPLVIVLAAVCAGIAVDRWATVPITVWLAAAGVGWVFWISLWRRGSLPAASVVLLAAVAASGGAWHHFRWSLFPRDHIACCASYQSQPVCIEAVALSCPRRVPAPPWDPMRIIPTGDRSRLDVRATAIRDGDRWLAVTGKVGLSVEGHLLGVRAGDRLRVFGHLSRVWPPDNPGEFDYAAHLRADRTLCTLRSPYPDCVSVTGQGSTLNPMRWVDTARSNGNRLLWRYIDDRQNELAAAVLLGAREQIDNERTEAFMKTGTIHLLAISGFHVGIVAWLLHFVLRLLLVPQQRALLIVVLAVVAYTVLSGARPPAVRAAILVTVLCAAQYFGRRPQAFNSLAAAGLVVLALNPADLFRVGVHLSFVAVAAIIWFAGVWFTSTREQDPLDRLVGMNREWHARAIWLMWRSLRHLTLISATIWLVTLPLVMARFHVCTPVSVLLNTVLWIPMVVALSSGFGVLVFGWILPPLGALCGRCCNGSLWLLQSCVDWAAGLPGSYFWVAGPAEWWLVGFYGGLALAAALPALRPTRRTFVLVLTAWAAVGLIASTIPRQKNRLDCTFLSVGHGTAVVLELPGGETVLYDAGQMSSPRMGTRTVAAFLWSRGITRIDAVVLSHADADHYNMLPGLLERFPVGAVYVSPVMFQKEGRAVEALAEAIDRRGVPLHQICSGDSLPIQGGCTIKAIHPSGSNTLGGDNADSLTLAVEYLGQRILLPGDLEHPGINDLLAQEPWDCDLLMAPHHGSPRSRPAGLALWCRPEWVVVSGSRDVDLEKIATAYEDAQILNTGKAGAVQVSIDTNGLEVSGFLDRADQTRW